MSPRSKEEERDYSMARQYRMGLPRTKETKVKEFDPYSGRMEDRDHFANFLNAILAGEQKSIDFLKSMPTSRKDELKRTHANSGLALQILDSF